MAVILPHTELEGAYAIAERIRAAIGALRVSRLDGEGELRVTASLGVSASSDGHKQQLVADADTALYEAEREGKNRTLQGHPETAKVVGAE